MVLLRAFTPESSHDLHMVVQMLWQMREREFQYVAVDLLGRYRNALGPDTLPVLLALTREKSWWDSVDGLASVIGSIVRHYRDDGQCTMDQAISDENLWVRRVAMLHQLGWRTQTDSSRLFAYAELFGPEKEFFIQKAVGWALRDYARCDSQAVRAFLYRSAKNLSALSIREAERHLNLMGTQ
jgi:3-methyladenine DNA glycosylase AlkD